MGSVVREDNDPERLYGGHKVSQVGLVTDTEEIIFNFDKMYSLLDSTFLYHLPALRPE